LISNIPKENQEEVPPELEEIIYGYEQLSLTLGTNPPVFCRYFWRSFGSR